MLHRVWKRDGENGLHQHGKTWQMWQEISGSCHRNISEHQHVTGPLQGGKGFPVFPERKGFSSQKLGLEAEKTFLIIRSKDTYLLGKQYVSFDQTIRMLFNTHSECFIKTLYSNQMRLCRYDQNTSPNNVRLDLFANHKIVFLHFCNFPFVLINFQSF